MKDRFGNEMVVHIVSGRSEPEKDPAYSNVILTILLKSRLETKKVDISRSARNGELVASGFKQDLGGREKDAEEIAARVARGDRSIGKVFFREALEAYGAKDKLKSKQIEEVIMGVFLVGEISNL
jgi:hypothetical protein